MIGETKLQNLLLVEIADYLEKAKLSELANADKTKANNDDG